MSAAPQSLSYVESLRSRIGHDPILMPCAGCAVLDDAGRVLLQRRGEGGVWGLPGGSMELGESVEQTACRETFEETGLGVEPVELLGVYTGAGHTYGNGDVVFSVVVVLVARVVSGELQVDGVETAGLGWFDLDDLPAEVFEPHRPMLDDLVVGRRATWT